MNARVLAILALLVIPIPTAKGQPYAENVARAEQYLFNHFNPSLGLIYESEDAGQHWLRKEQPNYHWRYDQTYWLYSDNLFAYLALHYHYPTISDRIKEAMNSYGQPSSELFEVLDGEHVPLPLHNAQDFIVAQNHDYAIMIRRHNATSIAMGMYVDFWMYLALDRAMEGDLATSTSLVHNAELLWRKTGLWDWSFTVYDHMFSNQKLALLLFTARALGISLEHESEMEAHLWGMQNSDGGVVSLSFPNGTKGGSANAETTALTLLVYDQNLLSKFPKTEQSQTGLLILSVLTGLGVVLAVTNRLRKHLLRPRHTGGTADQNAANSWVTHEI